MNQNIMEHEEMKLSAEIMKQNDIKTGIQNEDEDSERSSSITDYTKDAHEYWEKLDNKISTDLTPQWNNPPEDKDETDINQEDSLQLNSHTYNHGKLNSKSDEPLLSIEPEVELKVFRVQIWYLLKLIAVLSIGGIQIGYLMSCMGPIDKSLGLKLGWTNDNGQVLSGILATIALLGIALGSYVLAIPLMDHQGRRQSILVGIYIGMVGVIIQMFEDFSMLLIGRFIQGLACGIHQMSITRYIEEIVPADKISFLLPLYFFSINSARFIVLIIATGMPEDNNIDELTHTGYWRFVIGYAIFLYILFFLGVKLIIHHDSVKYHIIKKQIGKAKKAIRQIYHYSHTEQEVLEYLQKSLHLDTLEVSYRKAVISPKYRRGTLVLIVLAVMHQISGYQQVNLLSRYLLRNISSSGHTTMNSNENNWLIASLILVASLVSIEITRRFERKTVLIAGYCILTLFNIVIGIGVASEAAYFSYVCALTFIIVFQLLNGQIIWLYIVEVSVEINLGMSSLVQWITLIVVTFGTPQLVKGMHSPIYFVASGICAFGAIFCYKFVKETKGLTDKQKKNLYAFKEVKPRRQSTRSSSNITNQF
ncbi:sugar transporter family protein [Stylonychia lemnae]|uniref:Sugar transporter family protein n=1 Tax=Stylonychia lemnae TaxID=5949 RepID=A0A077ZSP1_STYLE|nr:sugar transporter family protein [Stylonychia lemnae]|eukprot:CDW71496.1 sugar transporter family protein [Stylonychia lemnae]